MSAAKSRLRPINLKIPNLLRERRFIPKNDLNSQRLPRQEVVSNSLILSSQIYLVISMSKSHNDF
jgi:hypothetical protein